MKICFCTLLFLAALSPVGTLHAFTAYDGTFSVAASAGNEVKNSSNLNPENILDMGYPARGDLAGDVDIRLLLHDSFTLSVANSTIFRYNHFDDTPEDADEWEHDNSLKQLYGTVYIGDSLIVDAGRKVERNGVMFFRNPADFFQSAGTSSLARSREDRDADLEGNVLVKAEYFVGNSLLLNVVYSHENDMVDNKLTQAQAGVSYLFDAADIAFLGYYGDELKLGSAASATIGNSTVLRGECGIAEKGERVLSEQVDVDPNSPYGGTYYEPYQSTMRYPWEAALGGHYTFSGGSEVYMEYYYNHIGYTRSEWDTLMDITDECGDVSLFFNKVSMLQLNGAIRDTGGLTAARRHYLFLRYAKRGIVFDGFHFSAATVIGLEEPGGLITVMPEYEIAYKTTVRADATLFGGTTHSEFELMYHRMSVGFEVERIF